MRNLREKLMAVASKPSQPRFPSESQVKSDPFFCREHIFSIHTLGGIENVSLEEICSLDPLFTGSSWDTRRVLFLDTETTGLSGGAGTVAFEVGLGFIDERGMIIRQYIMRDYSEEPAMMAEIAQLISRFDTIVSFNGKSFDLPLLESRMVMSRIRLPLTKMPHLDLLHAARRVYKLRLKRCNLASLEEAVLGQVRKDDLPGSMVPQRYFDYIKTGEFALLEDVLRHNLDDVRSLACLTAHLCSVFRNPEQLEHPQDIFGVGKTLMRTGKTERARRCFRILRHSSMSSQAHLYLASSYKKEKDWENTISVCRNMIASGNGGVWPYIELAKYYEHIVRDIPSALHCANSALSYTLNASLLFDQDESIQAQIHKRIDRLRRKMKTQNNLQHHQEES